MWALMGEGDGMKYCTWDGDGGLVFVRAKEGRKSMGASSRPTCKVHTSGSDLDERCDIALSCTSLLILWKWIIVTCVYFPWLFYMLPSFTKDILGTFNNNGLRMIIPSVLWAPVWPGFAQYSLESLTVLDNTLRFNYRHYVFSAEHEKTFKPTFSTASGGNALHHLLHLHRPHPLVVPPDAQFSDS